MDFEVDLDVVAVKEGHGVGFDPVSTRFYTQVKKTENVNNVLEENDAVN